MKLKLHWWILIGMALGALCGLLLLGPFQREAGWAVSLTGFLDLIGKVFIGLLKMVIVPLTVTTMVSGVLSLGSFKRLGRMGARTLIYYFITTSLAVITGIVLVNVISPGSGVDLSSGRMLEQFESGIATWSDLILAMVPDKPVMAMAKMDMLPVIVFSLILGAALLRLEARGRALADVFRAGAEVMTAITRWVIYTAPVGVFALMASVIVHFGWDALRSLLAYSLTVSLGLFIHFFITMFLIVRIAGRSSPLKFFRDMSTALLTAFSSASSSATMPVTLDCLTKNARVPERVSSFVVPLGATVNMDGTALYEAVAAIFIAQAYGVHLSPAQQFIVFITATLAAVGAASIPSAGLFTMAIVLKAAGLPLEGVGLIIGVDRILDMMRTATNVWGDAVGSLVIARFEGETMSGGGTGVK